VRATDDIDLLIARDLANQALVKRALEVLPDKAVRELADDDLAQWIVVRVNDDITVDLMTEACGVPYEEVRNHVETVEIEGVAVPFADAAIILRMKQGFRAKDAEDRSFLQQLIMKRPPPGAPPRPG
jgi:predicted naringenin-chalcone synthase